MTVQGEADYTKRGTKLGGPNATKIRFALILTVVLLVVALLASLSRQYTGLKPNELGDLLAGIFTPAAFIWVALAALLQSEALDNQREDLHQTQMAFMENRELLKAQVEESKKQAELIGKQTDMLRDQEVARREDRAELFMQTFLDQVTLSLRDIMTPHRPIRGDDDSDPDSRMTDLVRGGIRPHEVFQTYARAIIDQVDYFAKKGPVIVSSIESVLQAIDRLALCREIIPQLTDAAQSRMHAELQLKLDDALKEITKHMKHKRWVLRQVGPVA